MSEGVMVQMRHLRAVEWCAAGARDWLVYHGFDPLEFVRHGISAERLEATGDALALTVVALARAEAEAEAEAPDGQ